MKLGIHLGNNGASATAGSLATLAARAEELGFDLVWTSDHVVIPSSIAGEQPAGRPGAYDPADLQNYWEAFSVLAFVAGMTKRVELGVTVIVVPQREPLLFAKQWTTLDQLSGGRTILGVGVGWNREEFAALGAGDRFDRRLGRQAAPLRRGRRRAHGRQLHARRPALAHARSVRVRREGDPTAPGVAVKGISGYPLLSTVGCDHRPATMPGGHS